MIGAMFVLLLQIAEPAAAPPSAGAEATAAADSAVQSQAPAQQSAEPVRRCRTVYASGSRVRRERVCLTTDDSRELRDAWRSFQDRSGGPPPPEPSE